MLALLFELGGIRCAVPCARIHEVLPLLPVAAWPGAPAHVAGMLVYRGSLLPVLDSQILLAGSPSPAHMSTRLVVLNAGERKLGLICPSAHDVRTLRPFAGEAPAPFGRGLIDAVHEESGLPVHLLSVEALSDLVPGHSERSHAGLARPA